MGRLLLARHGESEDNSKKILAGSRDSALTIKGMLDGYQLASNLHTTISGENIHRVVASPLRRAHKTARICANEFFRLHDKKLFVHTSKILQERHFGSIEGILTSDIPEKALSYRHVHHHNTMVYVEEAEGAETMQEFYDRAGEALRFLKKESQKVRGDTLVVIHAGIAQMIYLQHHNRPMYDIFQLPFLDNGHYLVIE